MASSDGTAGGGVISWWAIAQKQASELGNAAVNGAREQLDGVRDMIDGARGVNEEAMTEPSVQQDLYDEVNQVLNMPYWQRVLACGLCFAAGAAMLIFSSLLLPLIVLKPEKFALTFTLGNLLCVGSTCFLVGPSAQFEAMFHPVRASAAFVYFGAMVSTLFCALFAKHGKYLLVLTSLLVELVALAWYALSYIPYGRALISTIVPTVTSTDW